MSVLSAFGFPIFFLAKIGPIEIDASLSENHDFDSAITESPIEDGTPVSDNQVLLPVVLDMECRVSDATTTLRRFNFPGRSTEVYKELVNLQARKEKMAIATGLNVYQNMLIKRISVPRTGRDGNSIRFTINAKEILVVGDDAATNRDLIAEDIRHSALSIFNNGEVAKVLFG
jgi:hypothetical protein